MKQACIIFLLGSVFFASCNKGDDNAKSSSIQASVDSTVGARMEEINQRAMEDLEKRMTIEVKAKADSIVQARMKQGSDTVRKH